MKIELEIPKQYEKELLDNKFRYFFDDVIWYMTCEEANILDIEKLTMLKRAFQCATAKKYEVTCEKGRR